MSYKVNSKIIRGLRKKKGWTQEELGFKEMDAKGLKQISTRTIQKIENDQSFLCSKKMITNLANVLEVNVNEIIKTKTEIILSNTMQDIIEKINEERLEGGNSASKSDQKKTCLPQVNIEMTNGDDLSEEQLHHIFTVDEAMICQAYEVYPDADKEDIWDFQDKLRKYKFTPSSYNDLATGIGDTPSSTNFNNLLKMDRLSKDFVFPKHGDDLETLSGNTNSFFEHLSKSNKYHIESFIPKDESLTELILELIQNIEKYFKVEASFSEDFLIKSSLASLIEQLENKKIGLFFKMSIYRREEFDPVHGYMRCWETNYIKIKIKEWSGISVRTKEVLHEKLNRISLNSYEDGWRNLLEVDPIYPDDSEKEDQEKLPF